MKFQPQGSYKNRFFYASFYCSNASLVTGTLRCNYSISHLHNVPKDIFTEVGTHDRRSQAIVFVPAERVNCYKYSFVPTVVKI